MIDPTPDWQLDGEEVLLNPVLEEDAPPTPAPAPRLLLPKTQSATVEPAPPPMERILEAMLFVGGTPLTASAATQAIRGLTDSQFHTSIDKLNRSYRTQGRPYHIRTDGAGYTLTLKPAFRAIKDRLFAGPREARLSQPALDVLSLIAYRQPISKAELDTARGVDSGSALRQLVRLGLVAVTHRGEAGRTDVAYGTTSRFLSLFQLTTLDDLPRLGEQQIG